MAFQPDLFSDSGQASAACREALEDRFIHVTGIGWLTYDSGVWREVPDKAPLAALREWTAAKVAAVVADPKASEKLLTAWVRRLDASKLKNVLSLAQGFPGVSVDPSKLDGNPDLLNCPNGVVDLRTGELKDPMPWYYFTKVTGCEYDPKAVHADWDATLTALPESVLTWCQTRYGQGITGHPPPDHTAVVQQGGGANGKSTVMAAIACALGDYYLAAPAQLLLPAARDSAGPEAAGLRGARFVVIEETPETGRLNTQSLKTLVGTPTVTARRLYQDYITFVASHTLFLNTNYAPTVTETDHGTWRRLLLLVFPYTFVKDPLEPDTERQGDPELVARLREDDQRRAVLAWLVAGARRFYADGLGEPPAMVVSDTAEWRGTTDHVAAFWDEYLEAAPDHCIAVTDMMRRYNDFMRDLGGSAMHELTFSRRFKDHRTTREAHVYKTVVRIGPRNITKFSRPHRDEWKTEPPLPDGLIKAWKGVKFRGQADASGAFVTTVTDSKTLNA